MGCGDDTPPVLPGGQQKHLEDSDLDSNGDSESEMDCGSEPHYPQTDVTLSEHECTF